jgi:hypothetical protein
MLWIGGAEAVPALPSLSDDAGYFEGGRIRSFLLTSVSVTLRW